jgi:SecD/SecF fusion protein
MQSEGIANIQVLMAVDQQLDVTGEDLAFASSGFDASGAPAVRFKLTDSGSGRFLALTTNNAPDGQHRGSSGSCSTTCCSRPQRSSRRSPATVKSRGTSPARKLTELVRILEGGQLPAASPRQPIAENQIDATLGADTIAKVLIAISHSLVLVLIVHARLLPLSSA